VPIAVIARLDDETAQAQVEMFADGLPDRCSVRPPLHLKLATYSDDTDIAALDEALARAIRPWTQLSISLVGFGVFPGDPSDVWLLPVPIHRLLQLHTEVDTGLFEAARRHCYEFGIWMPTVSLGKTTDDSDSVEVLVRLYNGPIDVMFDRVELVRTDPFEIITSRMLAG
jgi:2'-5' RNA ligase